MVKIPYGRSYFEDLTKINFIILPFKFHECPFFLKGYFEQLFSVSAAGKSVIILLPNFCMFSQMLLLFKLTIACWRIFFMAVQDDYFFERVTAMLADNRRNNNKTKGKVFWLKTVNQIHKNTVFITYFMNIIIWWKFLILMNY